MPKTSTPPVETLDWPDLPRLLTEREVAAIARCSTRNVRRWRALGWLRAWRPGGGHPLYDRDEFRRFIEGVERNDAA